MRIACSVLINLWGERLDRRPVSSRAMAAQAAAAELPQLCPAWLWPGDSFGALHDPHSQRGAQQISPAAVTMTPARLSPAPGAVAQPAWQRSCGTVTASNPAGNVGGPLRFLQPPRFWDAPCFSANSGLANFISGKVSECNDAHGRGGWEISFK